ncbi:MAG: DUF4926 domain-containing protein [Planctomycetes bacterium]|nr:DUF4926 domain-containing protein [Planctomycetota bacterium]
MKKAKLELYKEVALLRDVPEHGLKRGDVATIVDFAPSKDGKSRGAVLEVFDAVGNTLAVVIVPDHHVEPLHAGEVLSVRTLARAS